MTKEDQKHGDDFADLGKALENFKAAMGQVMQTFAENMEKASKSLREFGKKVEEQHKNNDA